MGGIHPALGMSMGRAGAAVDALAALANLAVALPSTMRVGFTVYSNTATHDVRLFVSEFRARTV